MKKIIYLCFILLLLFNSNSIAQHHDSIIQQIRSEYNTIVLNKEKYKTVVINVPPQDLYPFDGEGDAPTVEQIVTYYIEKNEVRLISVSSKFGFWDVDSELIEFYLKNNNIFFIYQHYEKIKFPDDYQWETADTRIEERRIYYNDSQPIRCLTKVANGKYSDINLILQKTTNKMDDCTQLSNIGSSLISFIYEQDIDSFFEFYRKYVKNDQ